MEKPESLQANERTPYHNFSDGPVIVNVFGNLHVPFGEALSVVESGNAPPKSFESPVLRLPHADVLYPKVQHVYSLNSSTPESVHQELLSPGCENDVLPEHRLFGMPGTQATHESMTRSLERTNERRPETCYFLRNVSPLTTSQQGLPSDEPSHLLRNGVETAYSIASVHPQGIVSTQDITSSKPVQRKTQATQYPHEKGATPDFGPLLHRPTQSLSSKQRGSERPPLQSQFLVYAPQQGNNLSSDSITSSPCVKTIFQDSWKEIFSKGGTASFQPLNQPIRQDAHVSVATDRIASGTNPDFNQFIQNEVNFVSLVGQEQITVNNIPVPASANDTRLPSSASLHSLSQHQGFPVTQLPRVFRPFEVSEKGIAAMNPDTQSNLNDFSTHVNSSSSFLHSKSSITVPMREVETEKSFENRRDIISSVLKLNHAETHTSSKHGKTVTSRQDSEHEREKTKWVIDKNGAFLIDVGQQTRAKEQLYVSGNEQMPFQASGDSRSSDYCQIDNRRREANLLVQQQQRPYEEGQPQPLLQQNQEQRFSLQQLKQRQWQQSPKQLRQKWQLQQRQHQQPQQESEQWHNQQQGNQQALSLQQLNQRQHQQPLLSVQWPQQQEKQHVLSLQQLEQQQWHLRLKQRRHQQKHLPQRQQQQPQLQSEQRHQRQQQQEKQHALSLQQLEQQQWQQRLKQRMQQQRHPQQRQHQQLEQQEQQWHVLQHQQQQPEKQQLQQHQLLFQHQPFHQHPQTQSQIEQEQMQLDQEQQLQKQDHRQRLEKRLYQLPHRPQQQPNHESQIQALPSREQLASLIQHQQQANWLPSRSELNHVVREGMQNPPVSTPLSASQCAATIRGQSDNSQNVSSPNAPCVENTSSTSIQSNSATLSISNGVLGRS